MSIAGNIPENVLYVCNKKLMDVKVKKSDTVVDDIFNSFPVDPLKKNTVQTARKWATGNRWSHQTTEYLPEIEFTHPNTPIFGVKIVSFDHRQTDTTFKAIVHDRFYVDIKIKHLMDVMSNSSITNNVIGCGMLWIKLGSQMSLVRDGCDEHEELKKLFTNKEGKKIDALIPIKTKDLVVGSVYSNKHTNFRYAGKIDKFVVFNNCSEQYNGYPRVLTINPATKKTEPSGHMILNSEDSNSKHTPLFSQYGIYGTHCKKSITAYSEKKSNKNFIDDVKKTVESWTSIDVASEIRKSYGTYTYSFMNRHMTPAEIADDDILIEKFVTHNAGHMTHYYNLARLVDPKLEIIYNSGNVQLIKLFTLLEGLDEYVDG